MASFGKFRFLTLIKPVLHILPEVAPPDRKIPFKVRAAAGAADLGVGLPRQGAGSTCQRSCDSALLRLRRLGMRDGHAMLAMHGAK